jgi:hypothetical protein
MMRVLLLVLVFFYVTPFPAAVPSDDTLAKKTSTASIVYMDAAGNQYCKNVVGILNPLTNQSEHYVFDNSLYHLKIDTLPQIRFWREIMNLHQDSAIISFASNRQRIEKVCINEWNCKSELQKKLYRDSVRASRGLDTSSRILFTTGKKFFYDFDKTSRNFHQGINCFIENNVDPWYAQAILLIESPNKLQKCGGHPQPFNQSK